MLRVSDGTILAVVGAEVEVEVEVEVGAEVEVAVEAGTAVACDSCRSGSEMWCVVACGGVDSSSASERFEGQLAVSGNPERASCSMRLLAATTVGLGGAALGAIDVGRLALGARIPSERSAAFSLLFLLLPPRMRPTPRVSRFEIDSRRDFFSCRGESDVLRLPLVPSRLESFGCSVVGGAEEDL